MNTARRQTPQQRAAKFRRILDGKKSENMMTDWDILDCVPGMSRVTLCTYRKDGPDKMSIDRFCKIMQSIGASGQDVCEILGFTVN